MLWEKGELAEKIKWTLVILILYRWSRNKDFVSQTKPLYSVSPRTHYSLISLYESTPLAADVAVEANGHGRFRS